MVGYPAKEANKFKRGERKAQDGRERGKEIILNGWQRGQGKQALAESDLLMLPLSI